MRGPVRRRFVTVPAAGVALVALTVVPAACSLHRFDRDGAVDTVMARYGQRLTRSQAECYVDRVVDQLGSDALEADPPTPEQVPRLTRIRTDCIGVAGLGTSLPPASRRDPTGTAPMGPGADAGLDALYRSCAAGSGKACDRLFDEAPLGSEYEDFALSCGGRTTELRCAERYPG
jgi:hypothetical protein